VHHDPVRSQEPKVQHLLLHQKHGGYEWDVVRIQNVVDQFICWRESVSSAEWGESSSEHTWSLAQYLPSRGDIGGIVACQAGEDTKWLVELGDVGAVPVTVLKADAISPQVS